MLLFDLDGTLVDSSSVWLQIDLDFTARRALPHTQEYHDFVAHASAPAAAQFTKDYYGLSESVEAIMQEWQDQAMDEYANHIPAKPHVREYLQQCRKRGEDMVILTSCAPEMCRATLQHNDLAQYFSRLFFAQELGIEKRDPALFRTVADTLHVPTADCRLYDDSPVSCRSAKDAGMEVVGVYDEIFAKSEAELRALCDRYILNFSELLSTDK